MSDHLLHCADIMSEPLKMLVNHAKKQLTLSGITRKAFHLWVWIAVNHSLQINQSWTGCETIL